MSGLYSKDGGYPQPLPDRDFSGEGFASLIWTDLANNAAGRDACGWKEAPDAPAYDPEAASLSWSDGAWRIVPFSAEQLAARLDSAREARWADALAYCDLRTADGCETPLGRVQTDEKSRQLIDGSIDTAEKAIARGMLDKASFVEVWTMADNSEMPHDFDQLEVMGITVGLFISTCYGVRRSIRAALNAASTLAELAAVDITAGYPA